MNTLIHIPENELQEAIECIWYQSEEQWDYTSVSIPFLQQEIIINFGEGFSVQTNKTNFSYTKAGGVSGIYEQPLITKVSGYYNAIGIIFKPHGLHSLLGVDVSALATPQPLQRVFGNTIERVVAKIEQTQNAADKIKQLEKFLLSAARPATMDNDVQAFAEAINHAPLQKGRIKKYLNNRHFSHKKFINRFSTAYGLSPQKYLRLKQVNEAIAQMARQPKTPLIDIAIDNGFYDQAHFIRTFKTYTHITPSGYKKAVQAGKVNLSFPNTINV